MYQLKELGIDILTIGWIKGSNEYSPKKYKGFDILKGIDLKIIYKNTFIFL